MTNKKKLFIGIAVILVVIIILLVMFLPKDTPEKTTIDLNYLLNVNREHFEKLETLDSTVNIHFDVCVERPEMPPSYSFMDLTVNTESDFKANNRHVEATYLENQSNDNLENLSTTIQELYLMSTEDGDEIYARQEHNGQKGGWYTNVDVPQLVQISENRDFSYIEGYENVLTLTDDIIEVDGVRCYKVSGRIFNIQKILNHYDIKQLQVVVNMFFDCYSDVELYFREDNYLLHSFTYDLSKYWQDEFNLIPDNEGVNTSCNYTVTVTYNKFNQPVDVVVPESIREEAVEVLKDPYEYPFNIDNRYYNVSIGDIEWKLGAPISEYLERVTMIPLFEDDYISEHGELVLPNESVAILVKDGVHDDFIIYGQNITNNPVSYKDCYISRIDFGNSESLMGAFNIANKVNGKTTLAEACKVFGKYNIMHQFDGEKDIYWRSIVDGADIHMMFSDETNLITYVQIESFNLYHFLGLDEPNIDAEAMTPTE